MVPDFFTKKASLSYLPNGDWSRRDRIEVWVPNAVQHVNKAQIVSAVSEALCHILAGSKMTVYPRHRWTRADAAFDEFCLLEGIHGLASLVFPQWSRAVGAVKAKASLPVSNPGEDDGVEPRDNQEEELLAIAGEPHVADPSFVHVEEPAAVGSAAAGGRFSL